MLPYNSSNQPFYSKFEKISSQQNSMNVQKNTPVLIEDFSQFLYFCESIIVYRLIVYSISFSILIQLYTTFKS